MPKNVIQLIVTGKDLSEKQLDNVNRNLDKIGKRMQQVGKTSMVAGAAIAAGLGFAVKGAAAVEAGVHNALTLVDATETEFAQMKASMTALADKLASDLGQSAHDISVGFYQTLSAGVPVATKGFETLTTIALKLAKTVGLDTAESVELLADSVNAFGFEMEQAERVADVFFTTSKLVATTVPQLREAMRTAAPTAASLGVNIETTATMLAALAAQGVKASEAGVGFRQIMLKLGAPTEEAKAKLRTLNVTLFDQQGNMRDMIDVVDELQRAMSGMTDQQVATTLETLVGERAFTKLGIILNTNIDTMRRWRARMEETGSIQKAFEVKMSSTSGVLEILREKMQGVRNEIGRALLPIVQSLARSLFPVIDGFARFAAQHTGLTKAVALLSMTLIGGGGLAFAIGTIIRLLPFLSIALGALTGPIGMAIISVSALVALLTLGSSKTKEYKSAVDEWNTKQEESKRRLEEVTSALKGNADRKEQLERESEKLREKVKQETDVLGPYHRLLAATEKQLIENAKQTKSLTREQQQLTEATASATELDIRGMLAKNKSAYIELSRRQQELQLRILDSYEIARKLNDELAGVKIREDAERQLAALVPLFRANATEAGDLIKMLEELFATLEGTGKNDIADRLNAALPAATLLANLIKQISSAGGLEIFNEDEAAVFAEYLKQFPQLLKYLDEAAARTFPKDIEVPLKLKTDYQRAQEVKEKYEEWFEDNPIEVPPLVGGGLSEEETRAARTYTQAWESAINSGLQRILDKTTKFRDVFTAMWKSLASSVLSEISRMLGAMIAMQTMKYFLGIAPIGIGGQSGGKIISGVYGRDTQPMLLGKGEQILDHTTTSRLENFLSRNESGDSASGRMTFVYQPMLSTASLFDAVRFARIAGSEIKRYARESVGISHLGIKGI